MRGLGDMIDHPGRRVTELMHQGALELIQGVYHLATQLHPGCVPVMAAFHPDLTWLERASKKAFWKVKEQKAPTYVNLQGSQLHAFQFKYFVHETQTAQFLLLLGIARMSSAPESRVVLYQHPLGVGQASRCPEIHIPGNLHICWQPTPENSLIVPVKAYRIQAYKCLAIVSHILGALRLCKDWIALDASGWDICSSLKAISSNNQAHWLHKQAHSLKRLAVRISRCRLKAAAVIGVLAASRGGRLPPGGAVLGALPGVASRGL